MDTEQLLLAAVTALSGAVGILWRRVEQALAECKAERRACEEELRKLWARFERDA